jgi:hypothetical protein
LLPPDPRLFNGEVFKKKAIEKRPFSGYGIYLTPLKKRNRQR